MSETERQLLESLLDAFDRLYDAESTVVDAHALLQATAAALAGTPYAQVLEQPLPSLLAIVRSGMPEDQARSAALVVTDGLRGWLADTL